MLFWVLCLAKFGGRGYECVNGDKVTRGRNVSSSTTSDLN